MNKIWLKNYQKGVPDHIDINEYTSLVELLEESCRQHASRIAYVNLSCKITYETLQEKSNQFAAYLQQLKLKKGTRVALMMPNLLQYPIALFGVLKAGLVVVNTNPLYTPDEIVHQMNNSGAEVVVVLANFAHVLEKALPQTGVKTVIITQVGDQFPFIKRILVNSVVKYIKKGVPHYSISNAIEFNNTLDIGKKAKFNPVPLNHDSVAFLQYTGGTNGVPKGAVLTHGNMIANLLQASAWIKPFGIDQEDIIVTALPLYHIFSLTANCLTFLRAGAKNILITNPRDMSHFISEIKHSGFTAITGVNTLFNGLLNHPKFSEVDFSKLKLTLSGGSALQKNVALKWREKTKTRILEAYGLTEASPAVTINPMYLEDYNGSVGLPLPSTEVSIRNEMNQELSLGECGELCVKGPQVMKGYWNSPEETALVMTEDGFLKTGDIARVDKDGFVYLVDRQKDMIDISGFNVYPNEIEQVISQHPGVLEVGVVGVLDKNGKERVKACIVKKDPNLTTEKVLAYCHEHLTHYKVPKIIEFYEELPKTNVGKVLRRALRDQVTVVHE